MVETHTFRKIEEIDLLTNLEKIIKFDFLLKNFKLYKSTLIQIKENFINLP